MNMNVVLELLTPIQLNVLDELVVVKLAAMSGLELDQLRYMLCLFLVYPLALIFRHGLSSPTAKHFFSMGVGIVLAQYVLKTQWLHSLFTATVTFFLVKHCPVQYAPKLVFAFNMAYMTASHIYRLYVDYMGWSLDFTGPQMLLVIKLTSFAYNYYDGVGKADNSKVSSKVIENRKKNAIDHMPSLLEYFGYVYCFTTFLAGPAFEMREYLEVVNNSKFKHKGAFKNPSSALASLGKLIVGVSMLALFSVAGPKFPISNLYSDKIAVLPFVQQVFTLYLSLVIVKSKYYGAWKIAEGSTVLGGFGFEGFDENGKSKGWNGVSNMDIIGFEFAQSIREGSRAWNKGTQNWLERYVYSRNNNSLALTYFVSAFWHGFYPGYYFFFMSLPLATAVNRLAYKRVRPWFLEVDGSFGLKKKLYDVISLVATVLGMHYLVMPFQALSLEFSLKALKNVNYLGHIILVILYVVFSVFPVRKLNKKL